MSDERVVRAPAAYGWALGVHGAFENVGVLVGPILASLLWDRAGPQAACQVTAALMASGVLATLALRGQRAAGRAMARA